MRYKVLYAFKGGSDGAEPIAALLDVKGVLYGTAESGGKYNYGTVFSVTTSGREKVLHSFGSGDDAKYPYASLINVNGTLYGTTSEGGKYSCSTTPGCGTVFSILPNGKSETVLHSFGYRTDGSFPLAALIAETLGGTLWLFGTTADGGIYGFGTVFGMDPTGKEQWVKYFRASNGEYPAAPLIYYPFNVNDQLWSTTETGSGSYGGGTAFATGVKGGFNRIHTFFRFGVGKDGAIPSAGLTYVQKQNLFYGTTSFNYDYSPYGYGTVFALKGPPHLGEEAWVRSFNGKDGAVPSSSLLFANGILYGTTYGGGSYNKGTVFSIGTDGTGETVLHSFGKKGDGAYPLAGLIDVDGTLYGATANGGKPGDGTVFALTP